MSIAVSLDTLLDADALVENKKEIVSWEENRMASKWRLGMKSKRRENQLLPPKEYFHKAVTGLMIVLTRALSHQLYQIH